MAINKATLTTLKCGDTYYIEVDNPVLKVKKGLHNLNFQNKLKFENNHVDAEVTFFELADKDGVLIKNFCGKGKDNLPLPANTTTECVPTYKGQFEYMVTADDHQDLDPVIIIEDQHQTFGPAYVPDDVQPFDPIPIGLALLIGLFLGFLLARKKN